MNTVNRLQRQRHAADKNYRTLYLRDGRSSTVLGRVKWSFIASPILKGNSALVSGLNEVQPPLLMALGMPARGTTMTSTPEAE